MGDCREELAEEQSRHGDLFFTNVTESYHTITQKVLYFLDYAATQPAKFTMKTDDDTFVFVDRILQELQVRLPIAPLPLAAAGHPQATFLPSSLTEPSCRTCAPSASTGEEPTPKSFPAWQSTPSRK